MQSTYEVEITKDKSSAKKFFFAVRAILQNLPFFVKLHINQNISAEFLKNEENSKHF